MIRGEIPDERDTKFDIWFSASNWPTASTPAPRGKKKRMRPVGNEPAKFRGTIRSIVGAARVDPDSASNRRRRNGPGAVIQRPLGQALSDGIRGSAKQGRCGGCSAGLLAQRVH